MAFPWASSLTSGTKLADTSSKSSSKVTWLCSSSWSLARLLDRFALKPDSWSKMTRTAARAASFHSLASFSFLCIAPAPSIAGRTTVVMYSKALAVHWSSRPTMAITSLGSSLSPPLSWDLKYIASQICITRPILVSLVSSALGTNWNAEDSSVSKCTYSQDQCPSL